MNLVDHVKNELNLAGYYDGDEMNAAMARDVITLVATFADQGHSGFSAPFAIDLFNTLANYGVLTPIEGGQDEWIKHPNGGNSLWARFVRWWNDDYLYQNTRCTGIFKQTFHGIPYYIHGKVFEDANGFRWTNHESCVIVWENVPGVLSDSDNAFGCFLAGLAGEDDPLEPQSIKNKRTNRFKWPNAGCVIGPQRTIAWRVLDAQYFGLAQRRKRVFVVASARDDFDPSEILFEFEGVRRDTPPSRESGESVTHDVANCLRSSGVGVERTGDNRGQDAVVACFGGGNTSGAIDVSTAIKTNGGTDLDFDSSTFSIHAHCINRADNAGPQGKDYLDDGSCYTLDSRSSAPCVAHTTGAGYWQGGFGTLRARAQDSHENLIAFPERLSGTQFGGTEEYAPALQALNPTAVAYGLKTANTKQNGRPYSEEISATLDSTVPSVAAFYGGQGAKAGSIAYSEELCPTLKASDSGTNLAPDVLVNWQVRRLLPVECERLQGFPDAWTDIPGASDSARYKAIGNSMAVPVMRWIGERLCK